DHLFDLPKWTQEELETPNYEKAFTDLNLGVFDKVLASFKGTKAFFEKNEKEQMKEELYEILAPLAKEYIEANKEVMTNDYIAQWQNVVEKMKDSALTISENQVKNYEDMMNTDLNLAELDANKKQIAEELSK